MRINPRSKHKKRVIKWENVLLIPTLIFAISGIIKSNIHFITISIVQYSIITLSYYYITKITRVSIQRKGLLKAINNFINFE